MSERIDYRHNAEERVKLALKHPNQADAQIVATIAQAEATLALAEQARIANLIALSALNFRDADFTKPWTSTDDTEAWRAIRDDVAKGLGL